MTTENPQPEGPYQEQLDDHVARVVAAREEFTSSIAKLEEEATKEAAYSMEKLVWKLFAGATAGITGAATTAVLRSAWGKAFNGNKPPETPEDPDADFMDALGWTLIIGAGVGVATFVARRGAAEAWKKLTGNNPPDFDKA